MSNNKQESSSTTNVDEDVENNNNNENNNHSFDSMELDWNSNNNNTKNNHINQEMLSKFDKKELIRLMLQSMKDMGFKNSFQALELESKVALESSDVISIQNAIMEGKWDLVVSKLPSLQINDQNNLSKVKFLVHEEEYVELLFDGKIMEALELLKSKVTPLNFDLQRAHFLSSLILCENGEEILEKSGWKSGLGSNGSGGSSSGNSKKNSPIKSNQPNQSKPKKSKNDFKIELRQELISRVRNFLSANLVPPHSRLLHLLNQSMLYQNENCGEMHVENEFGVKFNLMEDHKCKGEMKIPSKEIGKIVHSDQVWSISFSRSGLLASASKDGIIFISRIFHNSSQVEKIKEISVDSAVNCMKWSWREDMLLVCCNFSVNIFRVSDWTCILSVNPFNSNFNVSNNNGSGSGSGSGSPSSSHNSPSVITSSSSGWNLLSALSSTSLQSAASMLIAPMQSSSTSNSQQQSQLNLIDLNGSIRECEWVGEKEFAVGGEANFVAVLNIQGNLIHKLAPFKFPIHSLAFFPLSNDYSSSNINNDKNEQNGNSTNSNSSSSNNNNNSQNDKQWFGRLLLVATQEKKIRQFDLNSGIEVDSLTETEIVTNIQVNTNNHTAIVNTLSSEIHVWDLKQKKIISKLSGHRQERTFIGSSFSKSLVASGSEDSRIYLWNSLSASLISILEGHSGSVNCVSFSHSPLNLLASASDDSTVRIWTS